MYLRRYSIFNVYIIDYIVVTIYIAKQGGKQLYIWKGLGEKKKYIIPHPQLLLLNKSLVKTQRGGIQSKRDG